MILYLFSETGKNVLTEGFMRYLFLLVVSVLIAGCRTYDVQSFGTFDSTKKSITVPIGGKQLHGKIKSMLHKEGWKLLVDRGPRIAKGKQGTETDLHEYDSFNSTYRLAMSYDFLGLTLYGKLYRYDISIIDNDSGGEVLTLSGKGFEPTIVNELRKAIKENTK